MTQTFAVRSGPVYFEALTLREIEVLRLLCEPCSTKETAARLGISFKTAVSHRSHIMLKAGVHDPISLFRWSIRHGYVAPELPPS